MGRDRNGNEATVAEKGNANWRGDGCDRAVAAPSQRHRRAIAAPSQRQQEAVVFYTLRVGCHCLEIERGHYHTSRKVPLHESYKVSEDRDHN